MVPLANASAERRAVLAALADCPHLRLLPDGYLQTAIRSADGIVLVSGADALDAVLECIATIRRERPRMAIVVSMRDADEFGLDAVIRAGVSDFVSLPATCAEWGARLQRAGADKISALDAVALVLAVGRGAALEIEARMVGVTGELPAQAHLIADPQLADLPGDLFVVGQDVVVGDRAHMRRTDLGRVGITDVADPLAVGKAHQLISAVGGVGAPDHAQVGDVQIIAALLVLAIPPGFRIVPAD
ncbi:MAG: hypothetical protein JF591_22680, partial [Lysobacter sp.]|nr:hypothetical protein [Lysobacter sp.]